MNEDDDHRHQKGFKNPFQLAADIADIIEAQMRAAQKMVWDATERASDLGLAFLQPSDEELKGRIFERWDGLLSRKGQRKSPAQLKRILTATVADLKKIKDEDVRRECREYITENFERWENQFIAKLDDFDPLNICLCLWAYNEIDKKPVSNSINAIINHVNPGDILDREQATRDKRIIKAFYFYAINELRPPRSFMDRWEKAIKEDMRAALRGEIEINTRQLTNFMWSYAKLAIEPPDEIISLWQQLVEKKFEKYEYNKVFDPYEKATMLWSCAVLNALTMRTRFRDTAKLVYRHLTIEDIQKASRNGLFENLDRAQLDALSAEEIERRNKKLTGIKRQMRQIHSACLWFGFESPNRMPATTETVSSKEIDLKDAFDRHGFHLAPEHTWWIPEMGHKTDICLYVNGRIVRIERDGPESHFLREINQNGEIVFRGYNGSTRFQTALMNKLGQYVIRIPKQESEILSYNDAAPIIMDRLGRIIENHPPGVYELDIDLETMAIDLNPFRLNPLRFEIAA